MANHFKEKVSQAPSAKHRASSKKNTPSTEDQSYQTEVLYDDNYFDLLSPTFINYVLLSQKQEAIDIDQPFQYLELGCAFAQSSIVHAHMYPHAHHFMPVI